MSNLRRIAVPLALIVSCAIVLWPLRNAFDAFVESRASASPITWALSMAWAFDFAWSFFLGAMLGGVIRTRIAILWAAAAGIAYGVINFAMTQHHFSSSLTWGVSAAIYGQYLVSCAGAAIGAWIALAVLRGASEKVRPAA